MASRPFAAIVLAAGLGTRMKSRHPKVMHPLAGRPLVAHVVATLEDLAPAEVVVVAPPESDAVAQAVAPHPCVPQAERLGTAHAVARARDALKGFEGTVLVLYGDTPLIRPETLTAMLEADAAVVVLGFRAADPGMYGRLVVGDDGLERIVEARDASEVERAIDLCNSGVMAVDGRVLFDLIDRIGNDNAKGEFYLTDIVELARGDGLACAVAEGDEAELLGIDSRGDLAMAEALVQTELRARAMAEGATLIDPASVFLSFDTVLGQDVTVHPNVVFGPGVTVADDVEVRSFSHLEGCEISTGATVGPFARLRPGTRVGEGARVGNFVEAKNAVLAAGAKANHLAYLGDAEIGAGANVGAGTITCNYDGFQKHKTEIGEGAFIGSNSALVAPVRIGAGAIVGAGSTIVRNVPADALSVARAQQNDRTGVAKRIRDEKQAEKAAKTGKG